MRRPCRRQEESAKPAPPRTAGLRRPDWRLDTHGYGCPRNSPGGPPPQSSQGSPGSLLPERSRLIKAKKLTPTQTSRNPASKLKVHLSRPAPAFCKTIRPSSDADKRNCLTAHRPNNSARDRPTRLATSQASSAVLHRCRRGKRETTQRTVAAPIAAPNGAKSR